MPTRPLTKPLTLLCGVLGLALVGSLLWGRWQAAEATRYEALAQRLETDLSALQGRLEAAQRATTAAGQRATTAEITIRGALNANPDWRNAPVPADIRNRLCEFTSCAPVRASEVPSARD